MSSQAEPNVVPLCDVLLVLLIIFMVITPMVQRGIDIKLPEELESIRPDSFLNISQKKKINSRSFLRL
jgi:biopolymer transport protein TolR